MTNMVTTNQFSESPSNSTSTEIVNLVNATYKESNTSRPIQIDSTVGGSFLVNLTAETTQEQSTIEQEGNFTTTRDLQLNSVSFF